MTNLTDYIKVIPHAVEESLCAQIVEEATKTGVWEKSTLAGGAKLDCKIRSCDTLNLGQFPDLDREFFHKVGGLIETYTKCTNSDLCLSEDSGYDLLRYSVGDFYTQHFDACREFHRVVSCSVLLNDNFEGGEFSFFDNTVSYKLKAGDALLFPSNFMYPHQILPVTRGERFSIVTWLF